MSVNRQNKRTMRLRRIIDDYDRMGGEIYYRKEKYAHDPELMEAYEEGCEHGYEKAMREIESDGYHERRGNVIHRGVGGRILYRHDDRDHMYDDGDVEYRRRRRNSRGEFI